MAQKTKSQLITDVGSSFADNSNRAITAAVTRTFLTDLIDSVFVLVDSGEIFNYDPTKTYQPGQLVLQNNLLYRCTTTTTGTFDAAHWAEVLTVPDVDNTTIEVNGSDQLQIKDLGVSTAKIADNAVTNAKLAQMADGTVKGNLGGTIQNPQDLTVTKIKTGQTTVGLTAQGVTQITDAEVTANSRGFVSVASMSNTPGLLSIECVAGQININSTATDDDSTVNYLIEIIP